MDTDFQLKSRTTVLGLLAAEELEPKGGDCSGKVYTYTIQLNRQGFCDKNLNHKLDNIFKR